MVSLNKILVDIIVVNWNAQDYLETAIKSLLNRSSDIIDLNILISDNGSTDDSLFQIKDFPVQIIKNESNIGFGAACNSAFAFCKGKYILLLNPDTKSNIEAIEKLVLKIELHPEYGTIGPMQKSFDGEVKRNCSRFPTFYNSIWDMTGLSKVLPNYFKPGFIMTDWDHANSAEVDHVIGSYMLIRRSCIEKVGFMDTGFFVYLEDLDLSKRLKEAGYKCFYFHEAEIYHEGGGLSKRVIAKRLYFSISSKFYYWNKHFSKASYSILLVIAFTVEPILRIAHAIISLKRKNIYEVWMAYIYLCKDKFFGKKTV